MPIQSSHRRLEEEFFQKIREDMNTFVRFGMFGREERTSRAIIALHNRVRRLEKMCGAKGSAIETPGKPAQEQPAKQEVPEGSQIDTKWVEGLMKNLVKNFTQTKQPEDKEKPKAKVEKVEKPKAKPKSTRKVKSPFKVTKKK